MLLCDVAITEAGSNKKTLVGVFDKIMAKRVPTAHGPFWVYAKLADLRGNHDIRIDIVHLASEKTLAQLGAEVKSPLDSNETFDFAFPLPAVGFPEEGAY